MILIGAIWFKQGLGPTPGLVQAEFRWNNSEFLVPGEAPTVYPEGRLFVISVHMGVSPASLCTAGSNDLPGPTVLQTPFLNLT